MSERYTEEDLKSLFELRKSQIPQYEIRDHLPGFEKLEIHEAVRKYGVEKVRWALRELGLHTGWKFRMLARILDGSANVNYVPEHIAIANSNKPLAHKQAPRATTSEPVGNVGDIDKNILAGASPEIQELVRKFTKHK